jgi:hypothetical protein
VVEASDQLSVAATSPAVNLNPSSPLVVGEFRFYEQSVWEIAFLSHICVVVWMSVMHDRVPFECIKDVKSMINGESKH